MMIKIIVTACLLAPALALSTALLAEPGKHAAIEESLKTVLPDLKVDKISPSPVEGVSEVLMGPMVFYITNDGKYLFQGKLIDMKTRTDLSEVRRKEIRIAAINKLGEDQMIVFPAKESRHTITVFTDIDCGYCRKLHNEIDKFNDNGITVRYLLFPRSGVNSPSYDKAVSVWCEEDRRKALTEAKAGKVFPKADCTNPVQQELELGRLIGVKGTPAIILDDGELLPGYVPANKLAKVLDTNK
jgi:thiol:disulfide interchange protein DsbC